MSEKYAEKIEALLRQAEDTGVTPEESEAFREMAERLMVKWGIDRAMVDARKAAGELKEDVTSKTFVFSGIFHLALADIGYRVAEGLGNLRPVLVKFGGKKTGLMLVGYPSDLEAAKPFIESIQLQATLELATWYRKIYFPPYATAMDKFKARRSFLMAFGVRVGDRLAALHKEEVASTSGAELVLFDRKKNVDAYVNATLDTKESKSRLSHTLGGWNAGDDAGQRADIGQNRVGGSTGRKAL